MKAIILNCSLKTSTTESNTGAIAEVLQGHLQRNDVDVEIIRIADYTILPGVSSDEGEGDEWPHIHDKILDADILVLASPTWVGRMSSIAQRVIERMDGMLSETDDEDRPVAFNHVAGFIASGNEDGAKHTIGEMAAALIEIGFTVPGQSWTYWNNGAAIGDSYLESSDESGKKRADENAELAAHVLFHTARALRADPIPAPSS